MGNRNQKKAVKNLPSFYFPKEDKQKIYFKTQPLDLSLDTAGEFEARFGKKKKKKTKGGARHYKLQWPKGRKKG